jgi:hypothetical protein
MEVRMAGQARHVGALAAVFEDGGLGWTYPKGHVLVTRIEENDLPREQWQLRPGTEVIGWVHWCSCGWRGRRWTRVADPDQQDLDAQRVYSPHPSPPLDQIGDVCDEERLDHVARCCREALAEVTSLAQEPAAEPGRLTEAAGYARQLGASWEEIGTAAGVTPQDARNRWHTPRKLLTDDDTDQIATTFGELLSGFTPSEGA